MGVKDNVIDNYTMHFKDAPTIETITKIKSILNSLKIDLYEEWQKESSLGTWCVRVTVAGTPFGTNGKGVTKEYCTASAYAEFLERLQNNMLGTYIPIKDEEYEAHFSLDEKWLSIEQLLSSPSSLLDYYFSLRNINGEKNNVKAQAFCSVQRGRNTDGKYLCIPFYSFRDKKVVYLPKATYSLPYGSNGMSSGNTMSEAVVQALSEIVERYVQSTIIRKKITPPDIPDKYVKRFPHIYRMYSKVKSNSQYYCMLKDCSLGGIFPVAALVVIEKDTGRYGIKFGCHPSFQIAMERTFTEATQGQDIFNYTNRSHFDFTNSNVSDSINIYNTYKIGFGQYPYEFFSNGASYDFTEMRDVSLMSNHDLAIEWIKFFRSQKYDVLIRDASFLGFPAIHIIIPGFSELFTADDSWYRVYNTRSYVGRLLMNPEQINKHSAKYIAATLDYLSSSLLENSIDSYYPWAVEEDVPFYGASVYGTYYLSALSYAVMHSYKNAAKRMKSALSAYENDRIRESVSKNKAYLPERDMVSAMYYYLEGMGELEDSDTVLSYLERFFHHTTIEKVREIFCGKNNCIVQSFPSFTSEYPETEAVKMYKVLQHSLYQAQDRNPIKQESVGQVML